MGMTGQPVRSVRIFLGLLVDILTWDTQVGAPTFAAGIFGRSSCLSYHPAP